MDGSIQLGAQANPLIQAVDNGEDNGMLFNLKEIATAHQASQSLQEDKLVQEISNAAQEVVFLRAQKLAEANQVRPINKQASKPLSLLKQLRVLLIGQGPSQATRLESSGVLTERQLIRLESNIGRSLFGDTPDNKSREFFCLDGVTWVWYEKQTDSDASDNQVIRYETHPKGILKVEHQGKSYHFIKDQELSNLAQATAIYCQRVNHEIYS